MPRPRRIASPDEDTTTWKALAQNIKHWSAELGFQQVGITDTNLSAAEAHLLEWLGHDYHGEMSYMARHGTRRSRPSRLIPGTIRVISTRFDYLPSKARLSTAVLDDPASGFISRYALGRDYHRFLRKKLQQLAARIDSEVGTFGYRAFVDSAPVLEKALAEKAGLGWIGKHTNLINRKAGSWFFLGELYTDLPLPIDAAADPHCGSCTECIGACPTGAIVAPYQLDARRCISYLTIELKGPIPVSLRPLVGNRIFGCDDCQLVCPWNRFATPSADIAFQPRHGLDAPSLRELFLWTEQDFETRTKGSAIRRIGYARWLRNLAVALGNAPHDPLIIAALRTRADHPSALVREHVDWALQRQLAHECE